MKVTIRPGFVAVLAIAFGVLCGCAGKRSDITIIWTDQAEFASYAELFNASQSKYQVVVEYKKNPADALINARDTPDIVIGPWLKGEKTRPRLVPLDYLFNEFKLSSKSFYSRYESR